MIKTSQTKYAILSVAVVAGLFAAIFSFAAPTTPANAVIATSQTDESIHLKPISADSYVKETGNSAVKAVFTEKTVQLKRGSEATLNLAIVHMGGLNAKPIAQVKVSQPTGYILLPKSVAEKTTSEQRLEAATTGAVIPGGIDMASFVTINVADSNLSLAANVQHAMQVKITMPKDLPDELVGTGFHIPIILTATDTNGNPIIAENNGIDVEVLP